MMPLALLCSSLNAAFRQSMLLELCYTVCYLEFMRQCGICGVVRGRGRGGGEKNGAHGARAATSGDKQHGKRGGGTTAARHSVSLCLSHAHTIEVKRTKEARREIAEPKPPRFFFFFNARREGAAPPKKRQACAARAPRKIGGWWGAAAQVSSLALNKPTESPPKPVFFRSKRPAPTSRGLRV